MRKSDWFHVYLLDNRTDSFGSALRQRIEPKSVKKAFFTGNPEKSGSVPAQRGRCRCIGGQLYAAEASDVLFHAPSQGLGNLLPVVGSTQFLLIARIADEGDLRQNRWHIGPDEDDERSLFHASVLHSRLGGKALIQTILNV